MLHRNRGLLQIEAGGIPWAIDPRPRPFWLPDAKGAFNGVVLEAGSQHAPAGSERLGSAGTREIAAGLDGTGDVAIVSAKVRYGIAEGKLEDRKRHEICAANDSTMKRNGLRLLAIIDAAVLPAFERGCTLRVQEVVRYFPHVALRHPRIAGVLDRVRDPDRTVRRWFGLKAGRGRPARSIPEARAFVGTLVHECSEAETVAAGLARFERAGRGPPESLANLRSREGELYQLSIGGIWVKAERLLTLPWIPPRAAQLRWDVYKLPA